MFLLHDNNNGELKHELISDLFDDVKFKLGEVVNSLKIKRCTAAFKYLFGYSVTWNIPAGLQLPVWHVMI